MAAAWGVLAAVLSILTAKAAVISVWRQMDQSPQPPQLLACQCEAVHGIGGSAAVCILLCITNSVVQMYSSLTGLHSVLV